MIYLFYLLQVAFDRDMHVQLIWSRSTYPSTYMDSICNTTCLNVDCQRCQLVWLELIPSYSDIRLTSPKKRSKMYFRMPFLMIFVSASLRLVNSMMKSLWKDRFKASFPRPRSFMETRRQKWGKIHRFPEGHHQSTQGPIWICWPGNLRTYRKLAAFRSSSLGPSNWLQWLRVS